MVVSWPSAVAHSVSVSRAMVSALVIGSQVAAPPPQAANRALPPAAALNLRKSRRVSLRLGMDPFSPPFPRGWWAPGRRALPAAPRPHARSARGARPSGWRKGGDWRPGIGPASHLLASPCSRSGGKTWLVSKHAYIAPSPGLSMGTDLGWPPREPRLPSAPGAFPRHPLGFPRRAGRRHRAPRGRPTSTPPRGDSLDRDLFVDLVDIDSLSAAVGTEAEVDRGRQRIHDDHEQHRGAVLPSDSVQESRIPEPDDQEPVEEGEEDQPRPHAHRQGLASKKLADPVGGHPEQQSHIQHPQHGDHTNHHLSQAGLIAPLG